MTAGIARREVADAAMSAVLLADLVDAASETMRLDDNPAGVDFDAHARYRQGVDDLLGALPRLLCELSPAARWALSVHVDRVHHVCGLLAESANT